MPGVVATRLASGMQFPRHWHDAYGVGVVRAGAQVSASGRGVVEAVQGDVITCHPGEVHDGRPTGCEERAWDMLHLEPEAFAQAVDGDPHRVHLTPPVLRDRRVAAALARAFDLHAAWEQAPSHACKARLGLAIEAAVVHCCHAIARGPLEEDDRCTDIPPRMRRVTELLAAGGASVPSLAELAVEAGLSRYQVLRQFKRAYGLPPHAWLLVHQALRARRLIGLGMPLADAALLAGFSDQSHMTRVFRRQFGHTPGQWQRACVAPRPARAGPGDGVPGAPAH